MGAPAVLRRFVPFDPDRFDYINFTYQTQVWAHITHVNSTNCFYAQPLRYQEYATLAAQPLARLTADVLTILRIVTYKDVKMRRYVRAKIININGYRCDLFAIDFGFILKSIHVHKLYEPFFSLPVVPLAIHCQLFNCNMHNITVKRFFECLPNKTAMITIMGIVHGKYLVSVLNNYGQDVVEMMSMRERYGFALPNNEINYGIRHVSARNYFRQKVFSTGDKLKVKTLAGESLNMFYVAELEDHNYDLHIDEIFRNELNELDVSQLHEDFPVLAFSRRSMTFGRGVIKVLHESPLVSADVYFIDEGRTEKVQRYNLKEVPDDLFSSLPKAIKCTATEVQLYDYRCQKYLNPRQIFYITILGPSTSSENQNTVLLSDA